MASRVFTEEEKAERERRRANANIGCLFIDSGAHSLFTKHVLSGLLRPEVADVTKWDYSFYYTQEFWDYIDTYAAFIKEHQQYIDYYVTVDVLFKPGLTWKVQKYLENEHGLSPVPVLHYGTPVKWIRRYLKEGYEYIGIGGLGQAVSKDQYFAWADEIFSDVLCDNKTRLPKVKTHGFAMTSWTLLHRYPWYSVDSASWVKGAGFGTIYIPRKKQGRFDFSVQPFAMSISNKGVSVTGKKNGMHVAKLKGRDKQLVLDWLEYCGVAYGTDDAEGNPIELGASNNHTVRSKVNLRFFTEMCNALPKWPWPLKIQGYRGFTER